MEAKAMLRFVRTSPQKARLVANLIREKNIGKALNILHFTNKRAARIIEKVMKSAVANAEENHKVDDVDSLVVGEITVNEGPTLKRHRPRARGTATSILKRTSHITIILKEPKKINVKANNMEEK
jgi:large subunit ribosomal protein L22|tara:strand:- start:1016 stop:1390 length:375 start_codon:yes stop_codon:yes gene_type:complete